MSDLLKNVLSHLPTWQHQKIIELYHQYHIQIPPPFAENIGILCDDQCINRTCYTWCQSPCIPLYHEACLLLDQYGKSYFRLAYWPIDDCLSDECENLPMVQTIRPKVQNGWCIFFDTKDRSCLLHHVKQKPYIGRIAHCQKEPNDYDDLMIWFDWSCYSKSQIQQLL